MKSLTQLAMDWAIRCFGADHVYNNPVRTLRLAEEIVEYAQSIDIPKDKIHDLIDIVYSRPKGEPYLEMGGIAMTFTVLCGVQGKDMDDYLFAELRRVLRKPSEHYAKRNQEKIDLGLK